MRTKKYIGALMLTILAIAILLCLAACNNTYGDDDDDNNEDDSHTHVFTKWEVLSEATCTSQGVQTRSCTKCGFSERSKTDVLGHVEVTDYAVPATCLTKGKTAGIHCGVCGEIIVEPTPIPSKGHTVVTDPEIPATCISAGKTEGSHCGDCGAIIIEQSVTPTKAHTPVTDPEIPATCISEGKTEGSHCGDCGAIIVAQIPILSPGHIYDGGVIISTATCVKEGTVKYTCTTPLCNHSVTETYSLQELEATEIYNQSVKYVGEIITYDKNGNEHALGTGFVIDANGKVVTNYHVIEDAYSAKITIANQTYEIVSVLAYDTKIDLAVLKINATGLTAASVCKNPVKIGETVYAIGSSRGMTNTYSKGIVTYADRVVDGVSHVQHDASITHGNSGGPLINVYGEVIGINTWAISDSQNLNFAVFTDELDNLVYGTPTTLAELCEAKGYSAHDVLFEWLSENYNQVSDDGTTYYFSYENDTTVYSLSYDNENGWLYIDAYWILNNGDKMYVLFELSEHIYVAQYASSYDNNQTYGYIDASTFTAESELTYISYEGGDSWNLDEVMETYKLAIFDLLGWFEWASENYDMGAGLKDIGFAMVA